MLPTQVITIPFTGGLDTKTAEPLVNAANFLELENVVFTKTGALKKRWGYESMSRNIEGSTTRIGELFGGAATNNEIIAFTNDHAYSYLPVTDRWASRGAVSSVVATTTDVTAPVDPSVIACDVAGNGNGLKMYVWCQTGTSAYDVYVSITDDDGRKYVEECVATGLLNPTPKAVFFDNKFWVFWLTGAEIAYKYYYESSPTQTSVVGSSVVGDVGVNGAWDVAVVGDILGGFLCFAYDGDDGVSAGCYVRTYDYTLTERPSSILGYPKIDNGATSKARSISITYSDGTVYVTWISDNGATDKVSGAATHYLMGANAAAVGTLATGSLNAFQKVVNFARSGAGTVEALIECRDTSGPFDTFYVVRSKMTSNAVVWTPTGTVMHTSASLVRRRMALEARPMVVNGVAYATLMAGQEFNKAALQPTIFVYDLDNGRFVSKYASGTAGLRETLRCAEWAVDSGDRYTLSHAKRGRLQSYGGSVYAVLGVGSTVLDFGSYRRYASAYNDGLLVTGGILQSYDGSSFLEYTPLLFPEGGTATPVGSGGSLGAGAYQYKFVYEVIDAAGRVHYSAASQAIDVTAAASDSVTLKFPVLHAASDMDRVNLVVYRTKKDEDVFFRVWTADAARAAGLKQSATVDFITIVDTKADTDIDGNEPLYTTGGYLENISPPTATMIASYKSRTFLAGTPEPNRVWFSKEFTPSIASGFNDQLTIDVDPAGGPITALGVLDDKLVIFKHSRCYFVQGNGPDDTSQGFDFYPQSLSTDVGCIDPGSVVAVPGALMFRSTKGIYAITSGLSVQYVGAPVERYNGQAIVSAVHVPDKSVVLFVCEEGRALVFDYVAGKWSTFTNHESVWCGVDQVENKLIVFRSDGTIQRQSDTLFTDSGNPVKMKVVTGWLAQGEQLGWQRVQRMALLGEYKSSHNLRVRFGYDFLPVYPQEATIPVSTIITTSTYGSGTYGSTTPYGGAYPAERFAIQLKKQKCLAVRVCIEDVNATGESLSLTGIAFRVGAKVGFNKQSHDRKIGAA